MKSGKVSSYDDLRLKIRPELSSKGISSKEAEQLQELSEGNSMSESVCVKSSCKRKSDLLAFNNEVECRGCKKKFSELFVCQIFPTSHCFCKDCLIKNALFNFIDDLKDENEWLCVWVALWKKVYILQRSKKELIRWLYDHPFNHWIYDSPLLSAWVPPNSSRHSRSVSEVGSCRPKHSDLIFCSGDIWSLFQTGVYLIFFRKWYTRPLLLLFPQQTTSTILTPFHSATSRSSRPWFLCVNFRNCLLSACSWLTLHLPLWCW